MTITEYHDELRGRLEKAARDYWGEKGNTRQISVEDIFGAINALAYMRRYVEDTARMDWLSVNRRPGTVHLTFDGKSISRGEAVRDAIDAAMRSNDPSSATCANENEASH